MRGDGWKTQTRCKETLERSESTENMKNIHKKSKNGGQISIGTHVDEFDDGEGRDEDRIWLLMERGAANQQRQLPAADGDETVRKRA